MSLKPLRLLSTFCWYSWWGLRRPHVFLFLFLSSQLQKTPEAPFLFDSSCSLGPSQPFCFCGSSLQPPCDLQGAFRSLWPPAPSPWATVPTPMLVPTVSTAKCDALIFFCFCIVFVFLFWIFSFPTKIMPRKNKFCMFPAVSSHLRIYHLHLSVFYSLCKNWPI